MQSLKMAYEVLRRAEERYCDYAVFVRDGVLEYMPAAGPRSAKLRRDPQRAVHEVAVVSPGDCASVLAARLRDAGYVGQRAA